MDEREFGRRLLADAYRKRAQGFVRTVNKEFNMISWKVAKSDAALICRIVERADSYCRDVLGREPIPQLVMDITACHLNGCRLDLKKLLDADEFDFTHDVFGIHRHINRLNGELGDCFLPRYAAREEPAHA